MHPSPPPLDAVTLRELERHLVARFAALQAYGPGCQACRDGELRAFLAHLQALLAVAPDASPQTGPLPRNRVS